MKVILIKDWLAPWGRVIKKGKRMTVDIPTGTKLLKEKYVRRDGPLAQLLTKRPPKDIAESKDTPMKQRGKIRNEED